MTPTPFHLEDSPDFAVLRDALRSSGYNESAICARLGITALSELLSNQNLRGITLSDGDGLGLLVRLLLLGESIQRQEAAGLSAPVLAALLNLGLVVDHPGGEGRIFCPFAVYPVGSQFNVSDRWRGLDGKEFEVPSDFIYPALTPNTAQFLVALPVTPCDRFLELCSGAGTAALGAASYAGHAWAVDITARSTDAAEFNRLLNGVANVTTVCGDCYEGLGDLQFDRIVAHPPYMPVAERAEIFYDGGQDGEQVTRRIVEGLPRYLRPGGCLYCLAQGSDRKNAPFEQRVRHWLGEHHEEFDVAIIEKRAQPPDNAALIFAMKSKGGFAARNLMRENFARLGVESLCYGWIIVQRRRSARKVFTVRRTAGLSVGREELDWLLRWETFAATPSSFAELEGMSPVARGGLELRAVHRMHLGSLVPAQLTFHAAAPFASDCVVDPWVVYLIPLCDGRHTVRELWEHCKSEGLIHAQASPQQFVAFIGVLISGGFLEVQEYRPPVATTNGAA